MKNLVIVESGSKAKTISKYLNIPELKKEFGSFKVIASNGHIRDLVKKNIGINEDFEPIYEVLRDKKLVISRLKENIKESDMIWLAADPDREGEAIAWHIKETFKLKTNKYKRITFNEITADAIKTAVHNTRDIDYCLVDAQQCRRILDRIVGFTLTQILWKYFDTSVVLSAGRVQSVVLNIITNRDNIIKNFISESYWKLEADFLISKNYEMSAIMYDSNTKNVYKITSDKDNLAMCEKMITSNFEIDTSSSKLIQIKEYSPPPFTTSTLQQTAYANGFSLTKTMKVAQDLYEKGLITYMRTDSSTISEEASTKIKKYIQQNFGMDQFYERVKSQIKKNINAQEAHEAIRPTSFHKNDTINEKLSKDEIKLYQLIFDRTVASKMKPAIYEEIQLQITFDNTESLYFVGKIRTLMDNGYLEVYNKKTTDGMSSLKQQMNLFMKNPDVILLQAASKQIWKAPPCRYNESTVIKELEKLGIGRPSTYSGIIKKLFDRRFVESINIAGESKNYVDYTIQNNKISKQSYKKEYFFEKNKMCPTEIGINVDNVLQKYFSKIINNDFTNRMEQDLDDIATNTKHFKKVLTNFNDPFSKIKDTILASIDKKTQISSSRNREFICNDNTYTVRNAKYGPVIQLGKQFINLKPYFELTGKNIDTIEINDVRFLTSLPLNIESSNHTLEYGRYGLYYNEQNSATKRIYEREANAIIAKFTNSEF